VALVAAALVLVAGFGGKPGGDPTQAFLDQMDQAARDVRSEVATAQLAVEQNLERRLPDRYLGVTVAAAERTVLDTRSTVVASRPPGTPAADDRRRRLLVLLDRAAAEVSAVRLAGERGDRRALRGAGAGLPRLVRDLSALTSTGTVAAALGAAR